MNSNFGQTCNKFGKTTGHLSIQTTSPFLNQVKMNKFGAIANIDGINLNVDDRKKIVDIFSKKRKKEVSTAVSRLLVDDLLKDSAIDSQILKKENKYNFKEFIELISDYTKGKKHDDNGVTINRALCSFCLRTVDSLGGSGLDKNFVKERKPNVYRTEYKNLSTQYSEQFQVINEEEIERIENHVRKSVETSVQCISDDNMERQSKADKKCYQIYNISLQNSKDEQLMGKIVERNDRLQKALKKLVIMRERDRYRELWNNFIHELKMKHKCDNELNCQHPPDIKFPDLNQEHDETDAIFETIYNPYKKLIKEVYGSKSNGLYNDDSGSYHTDNVNKKDAENNTENCQIWHHSLPKGGNISQNMDKSTYIDNSILEFSKGTKYNNNKNITEEDIENIQYKENLKCPSFQNSYVKREIDRINRSVELQTVLKSSLLLPERDHDDQIETTKEKLKRASFNCETLRKKVNEEPDVISKRRSLANIENKLDILMKSVNSMLIEIKNSRNSDVCKLSNKTNETKSDIYSGLKKKEKIVCAKASVCSVDVPFDRSQSFDKPVDSIPGNLENQQLKSRSVHELKETTASLSQDKLCAGEKIEPANEITKKKYKNKCTKIMNIAINTDPLGLFALLRISSDSIKQLLSLMPIINYYSYLPMLKYPKNKSEIYVCNICGAAFHRPADLGNHIHDHNLGKIRDCCICRHVLAMQKNRRTKQFTCQHCGQRFTRAYCCQLHQQECAKKMGRTLEDRDSLLLLR